MSRKSRLVSLRSDDHGPRFGGLARSFRGGPSFILRPTQFKDLDAVLAIEQHPDNHGLIGQWSRDHHASAIERGDREHWIIESKADHAPIGYIIAYNLISEGFGLYVKRITVSEKSIGIGRMALHSFVQDAFCRLGADSACLVVYRTNERAQRSYRAIGFVEVDLDASDRTKLRKLDGGFPDDAVIMRVQPTTLLAPNASLQSRPAPGRDRR